MLTRIFLLSNNPKRVEMEPLAKLLEIIKESIESLRWWAFAAILICAYLKYTPEQYQPFVSSAYLKADNRLNSLGLIIVVAAVIFILGWLAAGIAAVLAPFRRQRNDIATRRTRIEKRKEDRRKRRAEERLRGIKIRSEIRKLSANQLKMVKLALRQPDGILKVSNDAALDLATLLVTRNVFTRIRPWYNERGGVIGEVFVVKDWVKEIEGELPALSNTPITI
jgi:hypothetical protein